MKAMLVGLTGQLAQVLHERDLRAMMRELHRMQLRLGCFIVAQSQQSNDSNDSWATKALQ